ncbi:hypothetical protein KW789_01190 [Candidatus Saccharibacteria bacterium]|jgi:hypothetical protein|nr:hypothetical protein [Candidatus Saccharibacteria bacterium]
MSNVSKESLLLSSDCDCSGIKAWASTVATEAQLQGMDPEAAQQMFEEALDPDCMGEIPNPNSFCEEQCSVPSLVCGHEKGAHFLLKMAMTNRQDMRT